MSTLLLSCTPQNTAVQCALSWSGSTPSGVVDYLIFYYAQGSRQIKSITSSQLSVVVPSLTNGTQYIFRATAYLGGYTSGQRLSDSASRTCVPGAPPQAPSGLQAVVSSSGDVISGEVELSWIASSTDANYPVQSYNIYQSSDGVTFTDISSTASLGFTVSPLTNGSVYRTVPMLRFWRPLKNWT